MKLATIDLDDKLTLDLVAMEVRGSNGQLVGLLTSIEMRREHHYYWPEAGVIRTELHIVAAVKE